MDSFHKPSALSFDGNTSENWRRFRQQYEIYLTASASEKKDDTVKIAILLNFAGEDAIEVPLNSLSVTVTPGKTWSSRDTNFGK